ncbi:hypothetical protein EJ08DRAFT_605755 [Tothia fuscella]|uniref:Mitochondrial import inner membrane translocase subunit n=1 Tax=Tothia fuscella TaxID=1048955 RepID=A0A9P4NZC0_9PEZI|nr:hypothetical protein EJ08DRAFT_605755 [Tothia fuscella]
MDSFNTTVAGSDPKSQIMNQIRQEAAMHNARQLIEKINEHCFERCIPKPGTSISRGEESCFSSCMEKYMSSWNAISRQYVQRIQKEQAAQEAGGFGGI